MSRSAYLTIIVVLVACASASFGDQLPAPTFHVDFDGNAEMYGRTRLGLDPGTPLV